MANGYIEFFYQKKGGVMQKNKNLEILGWCSVCQKIFAINKITGEIKNEERKEPGIYKRIKCDLCSLKKPCSHRGKCSLYDFFQKDVCDVPDEKYKCGGPVSGDDNNPGPEAA